MPFPPRLLDSPRCCLMPVPPCPQQGTRRIRRLSLCQHPETDSRASTTWRLHRRPPHWFCGINQQTCLPIELTPWLRVGRQRPHPTSYYRPPPRPCTCTPQAKEQRISSECNTLPMLTITQHSKDTRTLIPQVPRQPIRAQVQDSVGEVKAISGGTITFDRGVAQNLPDRIPCCAGCW